MVALDVGSRSVRAVWVQLRGSQPVITRTESFALPHGEEDPHQLIATWLASVGLAKHFCVTALPGAQAVFQSGRILPNDPRTPEQVAAMDITQFSEMAGDAMAHDVFSYEPDHEQGIRRYTMAMARPAVIEDAIREASANHFRPADLIAAPVALYNALEPFSGGHEEPWCYVSIGHLHTEVAIGLEKGLTFARSIAVGGKMFTDAVAQALGLSPVQAEVRKHAECGLNDGNTGAEQLRAAADRWVSQFNACMGVYRSQFQDRRFFITKIVLSGGGAQLKGLKEYLSQKLNLPVITSAELPNLPDDFRPYVGTYDMGYGLAITALRACVTYLSLLPDDLKDEVIFKEKKPWWIATAILLMAGMGVLSAMGIYTLNREKTHLEGENNRLTQGKKVDQRIQGLKTEGEQMLTNSVPLSELLMNGPVAREVLTLVASSISPGDGTNVGDWITLFCDESIYNKNEQNVNTPKVNAPTAPAATSPTRTPLTNLRNPTAAAPRPGATALPKPGTDPKALAKNEIDQLSSAFIVEGYTSNPSLKTVRELIERLQTSPDIKRVDLLGDERVLNPTGLTDPETQKLLTNYRRFVIKIEVNRP